MKEHLFKLMCLQMEYVELNKKVYDLQCKIADEAKEALLEGSIDGDQYYVLAKAKQDMEEILKKARLI